MERVLSLLDEAMSVQQAVSGKIRLAAADEADLELVVQRGLSDRFRARFARLPPDAATPSALAYRQRIRVFVADVTRDPNAALYRDAGRDEGFTCIQATPIFGPHGHVIGTVSTHFPSPPPWTGADNLLLDYCATKLARVLDTRFPHR